MESNQPTDPSHRTRERLQAARGGVDPIEADHALARLEAALFDSERAPTIGRYVVLARLGQGGAGVVWLAHDPELDRRVAIKVLQKDAFVAGTGGRRRLIREARALASLSHPNVVQIYGIERPDRGPADESDEASDLVIVMEHVPGESLARWLEGERRAQDEILDVFAAAGEGLAAVHALGLVHRDFKPANVMVGVGEGGKRRVKVLDFGLAGAANRTASGPELEAETTFDPLATNAPTVGRETVGGGTPLFMSPEQHYGLAVDARCDQFAFCVSLWSALFGTPPFFGRDLTALAQAKHDGAPPVPVRTGVSAAVGRALARGLALSPADRWPSMRALLAAIARARRPRRWLLAAGATIGTVAVVAAVWPRASTCVDASERLADVWDDGRRGTLRGHAGAGSSAAGAIEAGLDDYAGRWTTAWKDGCGSTDATRLDARMACLERARGELGALVEALHRSDELGRGLDAIAALPPVERCADVDPGAVGPLPPEDPAAVESIASARERIALASALDSAGEHEQALDAGREALAQADQLAWAPLRAEALETVGSIEASRGDYAAAESHLRDAYFEALEGGHDVVAVNSASQLVFLVGYRLARRADGLEWARHAEARLGTPSVTGLDEARLRNSMGTMLEDDGRFDEAALAYRRALELIETERGAEHPDVATLHNNLGNLAERRGDFATAEAEHRLALGVRERTLGESHEMTAMSLNNLGIALHRQDRAAEAEPFLRRALELRQRVLGKRHPLVARTHMNLGVSLKNLGKLEEAESHMRESIAILEATVGDRHTDLGNAFNNLANILRRAGRTADALAAVRRARTIYESVLPADHPMIARVIESEAELVRESGEKLAQ